MSSRLRAKQPWAMCCTLLVAILFSTLASAASAPLEKPAPASQPAQTDLICHTDNPAECYPRIFSPTTEFQVVHDDQDLPPGLHVQLDMQTGQKVAKIYNPAEDADPALEGLPVDRSVVVVETEEAAVSEPVPRKGAPKYDSVGAVKEPPIKHAGFAHSLSIIKDHVALPDGVEAGTLIPSLAELEELSHDMYYGLKITEDRDALQALFCIFLERDSHAFADAAEQGVRTDERADFLASSTIAAAIRNNPPALKALEGHWDSIMNGGCRLQPVSLKETLYSNLGPSIPSGQDSPEDKLSAAFESDQTRLSLAVLRGLLKSEMIRSEFLKYPETMQSLMDILLVDESNAEAYMTRAWLPRKQKVARLVSDTFLDADNGAVTGVWPVFETEDESVCEEAAEELPASGVCWDFELQKKIIASGHGKSWDAQELVNFFKQARSPGKSRDEL